MIKRKLKIKKKKRKKKKKKKRRKIEGKNIVAGYTFLLSLKI